MTESNYEQQIAAVRDALLDLDWAIPKDEALADRKARWIAAYAGVAMNSLEKQGRRRGSVTSSLKALAKVKGQAQRLAKSLRTLQQPAYYALLNYDLEQRAEDRAWSAADRLEALQHELEQLVTWAEGSKTKVYGPEKAKRGGPTKNETDAITEHVASAYFVLTHEQPSRSNLRVPIDGPSGEKQVSSSPFTLCLGKILHALGIDEDNDADGATRRLLDGDIAKIFRDTSSPQ